MSATVPAWAETLLSASIRIHGNDVRKLRRAIAALEEKAAPMFVNDEVRAAYRHVIDGLKHHLAQFELPLEPERGP